MKALRPSLLAIGTLVGAISADAQVISESFRNSTFDQAGWEVAGNIYTPNLTGGSIDANGDGWLRLTSTGGDIATSAYLDTAFTAAGATVYASFEYATWGGDGADGMTFFLFDGSTSFAVGAPGGSLGYANRDAEAGMAGGYIGVGIDEYGNYSSSSEGKVGGMSSGLVPDAIAVRGSEASGYEFLGSSGTLATSIDTPYANSRPSVVNEVQILLTATNQLTVTLQQGGTNPQTVLQMDLSAYARPETLKLGFAGSTGGSNNVHEIRNVEASTIVASLWDNQGDYTWGNNNNWNPSVVPTVGSDILFDNTYVSGDQTIAVQADRDVRSITFDAPQDYTLNGHTITLDNQGVSGFSGIAASQTHGTGDHTINSDLVANNDIIIRNNNDGALTLNGDFALDSNTATFDGTGDLTSSTGSISGTGDVIKNDVGTVTLSGNNTYSGGTTLNHGTLNANSGTALGSGSVELVGGTLGSTNSSSVGNTISITGDAGFDGITTTGSITQSGNRTVGLNDATLAGNYNAGGNTFTADVGSDSAISGNISNGSLTKEGNATLTLSGSNSYTGDTTINNGTLQLGADNVINNGSDVRIGGNGTLDLNGNSERIDNLVATGGGATLDFGATAGANEFLFDYYTAPPSGVMVINNWEQGVDSLATRASGQDFSTMYLSGYGVGEQVGGYTGIGSLGSGYLITPKAVQYKEWDGSSNDNWSSNNNWTSRNEPTSTQVALFGNLGVSRPDVDLNSSYTIAGIKFDTDATVNYDITSTSNDITLAGAVPYIQQFSDYDQRLGFDDLFLANNTVVDITGAGDLTINADIKDSGGSRALIKDGDGTGKLILDFNYSTYSGGLYVNNGTVQAQNNVSLGTGTAHVADGATLEFAGGIDISEDINVTGEGVDGDGALRNFDGNNTLSGDITLTGDTRITNSSDDNFTLTGNITGSGHDLTFAENGTPYSGGLTQVRQISTGPGAVTIESGSVSLNGNASNTYTGLTTVEADGRLYLDKSSGAEAVGTGGILVNDGSVTVQANNQINDAAGVKLTGTGTLDLDGNSERIAQIDSTSTNAVIALGNGGDLTVGAASVIYSNYEGQITGNASSTFNVDGLGTVYLAGDNSGMAGTVNVDKGTLNIRGNDSVLGTGTTVVDNGANLQVQGGLTVANDITLNGTGTTLNGALQNFSGNNTFSGTVTLASDTLIASDAGTLTVSGNVAGGSNDLAIGGVGNTTLSGVVAASTLTKNDSGVLTLSGDNTYTGATTVSAGTLVAASDTALGSSGAGTTVDLGGVLSLTNDITIANEALTNNGTLVNTSGTNTYGGAISGSGDVNVVTGNLTLSNTNSYSGDTTVGSGTTLTLSADNALGSGSTTVDSGGTLALTGNLTAGQSDFTLAGTGNGSAGAVQNLSGTNRLTGDFSLTAATTTQSDAGTLILGSNPPFEDYATDTFSLGSNALTVDGSGHTTINAGLSGSGDLVKTGTGTLTVGGVVNKSVTSAFTGEVIINDGTLVQASLYNDAPSYVGGYDDFGINNDITIGNGDATAATLTLGTNDSGAGTDFNHLIAGGVDLTVNADGTLNTRGFATFIDDITLDNGTINANKLAGGNADALVITGNISATNTSGDSTINGVIDLNDASLTPTPKTIDVAAGGTLAINARVENGGISKTGEGTLVLSGLNSYGGATNVTNGIVIADQSTSGSFSSLGSATGGTSVSGDGQLQLDGVTIENETLTLNGTGVAANGALQTTAASGANTWTGQVNIAGTSEIEVSASSSLTLTGVVSGSGKTLTIDGPGHSTLTGVTTLSTLNKTGAGNLTLSGSAKNIGTANVSAGTLTLGTSNLLPTASGLGTTDLNLSGTGTFAMAGGINNQIDQLNVSGNSVLDVDGILTLNGGTLSGGDGSGSTGTMILTAGNTLNITNDFTFGNIAETGPGTGLYAGSAGTLELTAGTTLVLSGASTFNLGTLNVTGDTVIDFTGADANNFNIGTLNIADGVTVDVIGWDSFYDLWTAANFAGATLDERNATTAQITFNGFSPSDTIWLTDDFGKNEITVPEPGTYGALLIGASLTLWTLRRKRRARGGGLIFSSGGEGRPGRLSAREAT